MQAGITKSIAVGEERDRIAAKSRIREFVFGAQDGLLTTVSVVSAFFGAHENNVHILLAGIATGFAGMVAMTAGQYLSSKAEADLHTSEVEKERREIRDHPAEELAELIEIYRNQRMSLEQARDAALTVAKDPKRMLAVMAREELGIEPKQRSSPLRDAAVMAPSFIIGAIFPIVPYMVLNGITALTLSILLAAIALLGVGIIKARVVGGSPVRSAFESFLIGTTAGLLGYVFGTVVPKAFGVNFVGG